MRYIADLHIHSKYSRACSKDLDIAHLDEWGKIKGIQIMSTADFTHPFWLKALKENLEPSAPGLYKRKGTSGAVHFILGTELSCIYSQGGAVRRIHLCILLPDFAAVDKLIATLERRGVNLRADGRPIMGLSAIELTKIALDAHPAAMIIPAHAWTPWFSVFGSKSGFDSLAECFGEVTKEIFAIETGLSSDPAMNWRISALDRITLVSNSDAHSLPNLGREANAFEIPESELTYTELRRILKEKDKQRFLYTIEFFPEEGKYHVDGHRDCDVTMGPAETKKDHGICPKCKKPLTIGVLHRVDDLADRPNGYKLDSIPYKSIVPLQEIIAETLEVGRQSKKVQQQYFDLIKKCADEFSLLLDVPEDELRRHATPEVVTGILNVRDNRVVATAGYDGVYGTISVFGVEGLPKPNQARLL